MVTPRVHNQQGSSLIEFMVASMLALIAIGLIGSLFLSSVRAANQRGQELLLLQNMNSTLQQIKEDAQRAGYDGLNAGSLVLSGASATIHSDTSPNMIGYVYRVASSGSDALRSTAYLYEPLSSGVGVVKICEKSQPSPMTFLSAAQSGYKGVCFSVFDPLQINVTDFASETYAVAGESVSSAFTTVRMTGQLTANPSVNKTVAIKIKHRNWQ
ncbi:pilus assembly protein PilW [Vibrio sp. CAU 1672]|uniref:PilW family protein n=1 Tax=Vibrio sp. CAU 1672 TaxID=3032594 RepID=UPI0023DA4D77|nr:pilus assembly protein PilW [Vibrio sp. CAU 1672]MDF2154221.1 pilus assembly protein PilW [Vibrio sp. CAU 1672]